MVTAAHDSVKILTSFTVSNIAPGELASTPSMDAAWASAGGDLGDASPPPNSGTQNF